MNPEGIDYPFKPRSHGIPFARILERAGSGIKTGQITSGSGRELDYQVEVERNILFIEVEDVQVPRFTLQAQLDRIYKKASFIVNTADSVPNQYPWLVKGRHPDMFAAKFIGLALDFFRSHGEEAQVCEATWYEEDNKADSVNFSAFESARADTGDLFGAARSTWTGEIFEQLGFTEISGIPEIINTPDGRVVKVLFAKPV